MTNNTRNLLLDTLAGMQDDYKAGRCIEHRLAAVRDLIVWERPTDKPVTQLQPE